MTVPWSRVSLVAEHRDSQANALSVNCYGRLAILAGKRQLSLIELDDPGTVIKKFQRCHKKYDVTAVEWNPNRIQHNEFALASGEKLEMYVNTNADLKFISSVRAHTRTVADLDWRRFENGQVATGSIDGTIHIWDSRNLASPVLSVPTTAGVGVVKWNKLNCHLIASGHDYDVRIWDIRCLKKPLCFITAHFSKIHDVDWSPRDKNNFVTASSDGSVKFFNINDPKKEEKMISTLSPVWRARHTPFCDRLVTVTVPLPQFVKKEASLCLWSLSNMELCHAFVGHPDVVLHFEWCWKPNLSVNEYELVSWTKDCNLCIWKIDDKICGCNPDEYYVNSVCAGTAVDESTSDETQNSSSSDEIQESKIEFYLGSSCDQSVNTVGSLLKTVHVRHGLKVDSSISSFHEQSLSASSNLSMSLNRTDSSLANLQLEFAQLNQFISEKGQDFVDIATDEEKRKCTVIVKSGLHKITLVIILPDGYPLTKYPEFSLEPTPYNKVELLKVLKTTAQDMKKRNCLEQCVRVFISKAKEMMTDPTPQFEAKHRSNSVRSAQDEKIPYPRTSGARFCSTGKLVCFVSQYRRRFHETESELPRALSALMPFNWTYSTTCLTSPSYAGALLSSSPSTELREKKFKGKWSTKNDVLSTRNNKIESVVVYDLAFLLPVSKELAQSYILRSSDIVATCFHNKDVAAKHNRKDLEQVWSLAAAVASLAVSSTSTDLCDEIPWACHSFSSKMIASLIDYYLHLGDIQTAAMLCCISRTEPDFSTSSSGWKRSFQDSPSSSVSPYNTYHGSQVAPAGLNPMRHIRSNSEGSLADASKTAADVSDCVPNESGISIFFDKNNTNQYNAIRRAYGELLYCWGLIEQRALVLKYQYVEPLAPICFKFDPPCEARKLLTCAICHISVKGASNICDECGHGGHTYHILNWFETQSVCPTGCGCECVNRLNKIID